MSHISLLKVDDISSVLTTPNHVLIKPGPENDHIKISSDSGDIKVYVDSSYEPEKHSITYGEVIAVPPYVDEELCTEQELKVGDTIFFHYLCCMNAIRDQRFLIYDGQVYYIVNYGSIFCAKRDGVAIPVNGHILVSPLEKPISNPFGLSMPRLMGGKKDGNLGVVIATGVPLKGEEANCKVGDTVFFRNHANTPLQYSLFSSFDGDNIVYRMKYENIYGIQK